MTEGERASFNAALDRNRKHEEWRRISRKLDNNLDILGSSVAIALLRKIEALL